MVSACRSGERLEDYRTLGQYDIVVITSFPDDEAVAQFPPVTGTWALLE